MERLVILFIALAGLAALWLAWRGAKLWLRRSIRVDRETLYDDRPTLLYFHSDDCAPCRLQQSPILASLRQALGDCVRFQDYDALAHPEFQQEDGRVQYVTYSRATGFFLSEVRVVRVEVDVAARH